MFRQSDIKVGFGQVPGNPVCHGDMSYWSQRLESSCTLVPDGELNKKRYDYLFSKKEQIEKEYGEPLEWNYKKGRQQHYFRSWSQVGGLENEENWSKIQHDLVDRMTRLEKVVRPYLVELE